MKNYKILRKLNAHKIYKKKETIKIFKKFKIFQILKNLKNHKILTINPITLGSSTSLSARPRNVKKNQDTSFWRFFCYDIQNDALRHRLQQGLCPMAVKTVFASEISQLFDKTTPLFPKTPYLCSVAAVKVPQHYIIKALLTLCFWMFELPQSKSSLKQMLGNCHGVLYMLSVVCWGYKYLQAHFTDVSYTPTWVFALSVFAMAVVGQIVKQAEVKHPRFSLCS